jgi:ribose transport system ATP-binding protein
LSGCTVELKKIQKIFPGVTALDDMHLQLKSGEVHGLIGENGAGKSTLIKILSGVYMPDDGEIFLDGEKTCFTNPCEAITKGISCVYQELNIMGELSITDNIFLGNYLKKKNSRILDYKSMHAKTKEIMLSMGQDIDPSMACNKLGIGQQQLVEIGRAILQDVRVLILDEPTSSLGEKEVEELFKTIKLLKEKGMVILFVSHKLEEIFEICDVVTVMRDSHHIITKRVEETDKAELISHMVGRKLENLYPSKTTSPGEVILEVKNLSYKGSYENISFNARKGEILGFSGLIGAGRTELFRGVFAADPIDSGEVFINGEKSLMSEPKDAIKNKIAFLTEDRKSQGLLLSFSICKNLSLVNMDQMKSRFFLNEKKEKGQAVTTVERLQIKTSSIEKVVEELSGGNQQKVVIGKWINTDADIFIFDEPTRGIDVGAKAEVYNIMNQLAADGKCVIMISSELPEILGMCDRVIVMRLGEKVAQIDRNSKHFNQESIMYAAWGGILEA